MKSLLIRLVSGGVIGLAGLVGVTALCAVLTAGSARAQSQVPLPRQSVDPPAKPPTAGDPNVNDLLGVRLRQSAPGEVIVTHVRYGDTAFRTGIRPGDQILSIDGSQIATVADVQRVLAAHPADQDLKLEVKPTQRRTVRITFPRSADGYENAKTHPVGHLGVTLKLSGRQVTVAQLYAGGPADKADVKSGDVITAIDGRPIASRKDLYDALVRHRDGDTVVVSLAAPDGAAAHDVRVTLTTGADLFNRRLVTQLPLAKSFPQRRVDDDGWIDADEYEDIRDPYRRALDTDFGG